MDLKSFEEGADLVGPQHHKPSAKLSSLKTKKTLEQQIPNNSSDLYFPLQTQLETSKKPRILAELEQERQGLNSSTSQVLKAIEQR